MTKVTSLEELKPENFARENGEAHKLAESLAKESIKITQLRKFFIRFKSIEKKVRGREGNLESEQKNELLLLNVDLAYAFGRKLITKDFYDRIKSYLSSINTAGDLRKVVQFLEAVIAYHKYEEVVKTQQGKKEEKEG